MNTNCIIICITILVIIGIIAISFRAWSKDRKEEEVTKYKYKSAYANMQHMQTLINTYINEIKQSKDNLYIPTNIHKEHLDTLLMLVVSSLRNE